MTKRLTPGHGAQSMKELWRTLKAGDHVRVVSWPDDLARDGCHFETVEFYERLIRTGDVLMVTIDPDGFPWGNWRGLHDGLEVREPSC